MKSDSPDYYQILRVRADASQETIRASYRKLMVTLKMHPDLGGDHTMAAAINQAYEVLGNRAKREAYDRKRILQRLHQMQAAMSQVGVGRMAGAASNASSDRTRSSQAKTEWNPSCLICRAPRPKWPSGEMRCEECGSPLAEPPKQGAFGRELFGRRAAPRTVKAQTGSVILSGQTKAMAVKLRDLSLNGLSFYCATAIGAEQIFRYRDAEIDAVAIVVSCRKWREQFTIHARFLTVVFHHRTGIFVSAAR